MSALPEEVESVSGDGVSCAIRRTRHTAEVAARLMVIGGGVSLFELHHEMSSFTTKMRCTTNVISCSTAGQHCHSHKLLVVHISFK